MSYSSGAAKLKSERVLKVETLSHYGRDKKLQCSWPDCFVDDLDVLSLDHINNGGCKERKGAKRAGGITFYRYLRRRQYPSGFQTLCCNHQMKKEIIRRRENRR